MRTHETVAELMTSEETAAYLNVPLPTLREWVAKGTAPKSARIGKRRFWRRSDVTTWLDGKFADAS